ncbi:hypothetical protein [Halospeciosus flavus]|uniref:Lipoprotein n=1 Tax=Halospeciosus flavus TaxID=3032283 RepID=A0ABD5Z1X8_9EURY|nr:hypothetical protein [Halospeciosus flavus]
MAELSRRGVLAAVGSTVVSGCTQLRRRAGEQSVENQISAGGASTRSERRSTSESGDARSETGGPVTNVDRTVRVPSGQGWAHQFTAESRVTLSYTVEATKPGKNGFDVFVFTKNEYTDYQRALNGRLVDTHPTAAASVRNVEETASRTCTLSSGAYAFVVDNTPIGDGGKPRSKRPETVDISLTVRPRPD